MLVTYSSLKCASEPTFHQGDDQVCNLQIMGGNYRVQVSLFRKRAISRPVVGPYRSYPVPPSLLEGGEALLRGVWDHSQPDSTDPIVAFVFDRNSHKGLSECPTASFARFLTAHVGFVHLNDSTKPVTTRSNHRPSYFMKPRPCRLVAAQFQHPLDTLCACPVLLANDPPNGTKPHQQRFTSSFEDRTGCQRQLVLA